MAVTRLYGINELSVLRTGVRSLIIGWDALFRDTENLGPVATL